MSRSVVPHLQLVWGGYLGAAAGAEIWQCGLKLTPLSTGEAFTGDLTAAGARVAAIAGSANMATLLAAPITAAVKAVHGIMADNYTMLNWIKLNAIGSNTLQVNPVTLMASFVAVAGARTPTNGPWSGGLVVEHRTNNRSRGFGSHGRITYPSPILVDRNTGRITGIGSDTIATITAGYQTFMAKLNLQDGSNTGWAFYPSISYGTDSTKTYKIGGVTRTPVACKIDTFFLSTIPGQMRSRQNALLPGGTPATITYGAVNA